MKILMKQLGVLTVLLLSFLQAVAYDFYSDGIYYNILSESDRTVEVTYSPYTGSYSGIIEIPKKIIRENRTYTVIEIGRGAFSYCTGLTNVTFPESLTKIDYRAFYGCTILTNLTFPESLTTIGSKAFEDCTGLTNMSLPESLIEIGERAFMGCTKLENIYIGTNNSQYTSSEGVLYNKDLTVLICCPAGKKYVNLPESLTTIGSYAFGVCTSLTNVTFPESLTTIGSGAFEDCTGLTNVTFPESLTTIGDDTFFGCTGLTNVTFPESLTTIDYRAFYGCTALTNLTFPESLTKIGSCAFYRCSGLTNVTFLESLTTIGDDAFNGCTALTNLTFPESLTTIGSKAFEDCTGLTNVTFPESLTTIDFRAFEGCTSLTNVTFPESLTKIGDAAFKKCPRLKEINVKNPTPINCTPGFSDDNYKTTFLYVPKGSMSEYEKVDPWRNFWNIKEKDFSAVDDIELENGTAIRYHVNGSTLVLEGLEADERIEVCDMSGRIVYSGQEHTIDNLAPGIYIVKAGDNTLKIRI